jgi:hypothetical protein
MKILRNPGLGGLCVAVMLGLALAPTTVSAAEQKKLIEFGWDEPDTGFIRSHIADMQQTPFDGCVFHAALRKADGSTGSFTWDSWGKQAFTEEQLKAAFEDLRETRFGRFKENFLRFNTTPANIDWFDDHSAVLANAKLAAKLARAGHCPGILFDIEQYNAPLFDYRKQRDAQSKGWEVYAAEVRLRGKQVMEAFQQGYPGLTVFLTFGYCLPWAESRGGRISLAECHYGLLAPFLDGMLEAAKEPTRIVDGHETAYGFKTAEDFEKARNATRHDLLPIVRDPATYERFFSIGFGIWLDKDWRKKAWDTEDFAKNYFSPEAFEASVRAGLRACDKYVWIYSETPRWWSDSAKPVKLPSAYEEALRKAQAQK